ncbi:MAG: methyltransferase domain-containing protein [Candidatus Rokuibacteriota bacterium]
MTAKEAWSGYKAESYALLELAEGDHVLDVGCGTGDDARALALRARGASVVGVDVSEAKIGEAQTLTLGLPWPVEFRVGDAHRLDFEAGAFDACRADKVFHHLEDPRKALDEMVRVARVGARTVVSDVDYETLVVDAPDSTLTRRIVSHHADRMPSGRIGRRLAALFHDAGLESVGVFPYTAIVTEYVEDVVRLRDKAERAREDGAASASEAEAWLASIEAAARAGRFFCALTVFTVRGRKR